MSLVRQIKTTYLFFGIILIYFLFRLPNLTLQPIFADEAIYIRWAQIAKSVPSLFFISLQDGKTPLFMWSMAPFLTIFSDPLFAGRFLSIIAGFFTLLGVYFLGWKFFNSRVGIIAAFLIAITPFMIFFDRMALVDSMLTAFTIWSVYLALSLATELKLKYAIFLGFTLGGGWLTKTPGQVNFVLLTLLIFLFDLKQIDKNKLFKLIKFLIISVIIGGTFYLIQRIDPNFHQLSARNADYVHPLSRLLQYPTDPLWVHFLNTLDFSLYFLGPMLFLIPIMFMLIFWQRNRYTLILLLWSLLPIIYELEFIKAYTGRYILYSLPPMILLVSYFLDYLWQQKRLNFLVPIFLSLQIIWGGYFSLILLSNPVNTPLAREEKVGYFVDWTAGYGLKEIAQFLSFRANQHQIIVGTEGSFGTLPDGLWIYLDKEKNLAFKADKYFMPDNLREEAKKNPTFFVANRPVNLSSTSSAILLKQFLKPKDPELPQFAISFYQVIPN